MMMNNCRLLSFKQTASFEFIPIDSFQASPQLVGTRQLRMS